MRVYFGLAIAVVLGLAGSLRAEPLNLERIDADAKWVAHVDADAMRASTMAEKAHDYCARKHPRAEEHLAKIREMWHFNPVLDVKGITLYGTKIKRDTGVVILHAKVDQELLLEKARSAPRHRESTYGQYQLHTWKHADGTRHEHDMTGVFYRPDVIVFGGSIDEVKAALDVFDGTKPNLAGKDSPLAAPVPEGTMFLARVVGLADAKCLPGKFPIAKQTEFLAFAAGEKEGETFFQGKMIVKTAELAEQMKVVADGVRAMAVIAHGADPEAMKIIDALKMKIDGKTIDVECHAPAEKVWDHLKKMHERKKVRKDRVSLRLDAELNLPERENDEENED